MLSFFVANVPRPCRTALVILTVRATNDGPLAECFVSLRDGKLILSKDFHYDADPTTAAGFERNEGNLARLALSAAKRAIEDEFDLDRPDVVLTPAPLEEVAFLIADGLKLDRAEIGKWTSDNDLHAALQQLRRVPQVETTDHQ
jgi:hypothetical protein